MAAGDPVLEAALAIAPVYQIAAEIAKLLVRVGLVTHTSCNQAHSHQQLCNLHCQVGATVDNLSLMAYHYRGIHKRATLCVALACNWSK